MNQNTAGMPQFKEPIWARGDYTCYPFLEDRENRGTSCSVAEVHHEDITPADAALFGTSVSFTGPNAVTWMDALTQIAPLLACNEDYARFDQDPDNLKRWVYPRNPMGLQADFKAAAQEGSGSSGAPTRADAGAHGGFRAADLPVEIREEIYLAMEKPRILGAELMVVQRDFRFQISRSRMARPVMVIPTGNFHHSSQAFKRRPIKNRSWDDIKLYGLCSEAKDVAVREYGQPSDRSVPFRSAVDEVLLDVGFGESWERFPGVEVSSVGSYWTGNCYRAKDQIFFPHYIDVSDGSFPTCQVCISNQKVLYNPRVAVVVAADEEFPCPDPRPAWLPLDKGASVPAEAQILMHHTFKPASSDLLRRFRKVILRIHKNNTSMHDIDYLRLRGMYSRLGRMLSMALPRLETLTIQVEPMRDWTNTFRTEYDAKLFHMFDARRIYLLDGLTAASKTWHKVGCNTISPCDCPRHPFKHLKRLLVQVNTKKAFEFIHGGRRPYLEWFTDRPRLNKVFLCPKGAAPLSTNAQRHPDPDRPPLRRHDWRFEPIEAWWTFMDPRNHTPFTWKVWPASGILPILNRPDSPEPGGVQGISHQGPTDLRDGIQGAEAQRLPVPGGQSTYHSSL